MRPLALLLSFCAISPGAADILDRIGVMGDSLSAEYVGGLSTQYQFGSFYAPYQSWVEQLAEDRGLNFGSQGHWGFYRNQGYQYNHASVYVVDTGYLLGQQQPQNLRAQNPTLAFLGVGGNDFFFHAQDHATPSFLFGGAFDGQDPIATVPGMLSRYRTAMEIVAGTSSSPNGTMMVLATVPDVTRTPIVQAISQALYPGSIERYRTAIQAFNDGVVSLAESRGFAVLDMYGAMEAAFGPPDAPVDSITLCHQTFDYAFHTPTLPTDLFLHDGFHPGTIFHGLLANEFIRAVNQQYGTDLIPLRESEILENAGIVCPEASSGSLLLVGMALFTTALAMRRRRNASARTCEHGGRAE